MHTQADIQTVAGQIHIDRALPNLERADTDHETNFSLTIGGGPWRHALRQSSGIYHLMCFFLPVNHGKTECPLRKKMVQLMPGQYGSVPG